ncbi:MAG: Flp family type IVb pilin [Novosphingobium sp.]
MSKETLLTRLLRNEQGATAVEYGLILSMVVLAMLVGLAGMANETTKMWGNVSAKSQAAMSGA